MTEPTRAALLSALVFPGAGQILLRRYGRGALLILAVLVGIAGFCLAAASAALPELEAASMAGEVVDAVLLIKVAGDATASAVATHAGWLVWIVAVWVFSIVDAYRLGRPN